MPGACMGARTNKAFTASWCVKVIFAMEQALLTMQDRTQGIGSSILAGKKENLAVPVPPHCFNTSKPVMRSVPDFTGLPFKAPQRQPAQAPMDCACPPSVTRTTSQGASSGEKDRPRLSQALSVCLGGLLLKGSHPTAVGLPHALAVGRARNFGRYAKAEKPKSDKVGKQNSREVGKQRNRKNGKAEKWESKKTRKQKSGNAYKAAKRKSKDNHITYI